MTDGVPTRALDWSPRQRQLLGALGHTLERYRPTLAAHQRAALELDADAIDTPLLKALLSATGLELHAARHETVAPARVRLCWDVPGRAVVLPSLSALRQGAVKRSLWPQLRGLRKGRLPA